MKETKSNYIITVPPPRIVKKIISTYLIFVFMLMTFSGCERIKNSLGLSSANVEIPDNSNKSGSPANAEISENPKIPESPDNSNKAENPPTQQLTQETQLSDSSSNEEPVVENVVVSKDPEIPENSNESDPPPSQEELINQSNKSYDPPESDLGGPNNAKRARTIFFTTAATTLAAWVVGVWYSYKEIEVPVVLDLSVLSIAVIGIPATIETGINAYKATFSESNKENPILYTYTM